MNWDNPPWKKCKYLRKIVTTQLIVCLIFFSFIKVGNLKQICPHIFRNISNASREISNSKTDKKDKQKNIKTVTKGRLSGTKLNQMAS